MSFSIGISTWSLPWAIGIPGYPLPSCPLTLPGLLELAHAWRIGVLQIADNFPLHQLSEEEISRLATRAFELGITLEIGTRGVEPDHMRHYLALAQRLNATLVRTLTHTTTSAPDASRVVTWLRAVVPEFEEAGVVIALENYEAHTSAELARIITEVDSPNVGVCLDTVNNLGILEMPDQVFEELAPFAVNLHIKDFDIRRVKYKMGFRVTGAVAGQGKLDIRACLLKLKQLGKNISVILEQWPPYLGTMEETVENEFSWAQQSIQYLKKVVEGLA